jgi:hypothetical protein
MADVNSQVALGINAPDPQGSLNTLSKIMGLGQQGLAIRGQQSENISRASQAQIDAQTAKENQAGAQLLSDPVGNGLVDGDGNPTKNAQQVIMQAMPTTGSKHYEGLLNGARSKIEFNKSVNNLSSDERNEVNGVVSGVAADPNATKDDAKAQLDAYVESKKGTPVYDDVKRIAGTSQQIMDHTQSKQDQSGQIIPPGKEAWRNAGLTLGRTVIGAPAVVGAGGIATPQQANTGAGVVNRNPVTGALTAPPGAAPGSAINPTPPQVAGQTARQTGTAGSDVDRANQVSGAVAPANQTITITKEIDDLADQVHSGKISQAISKAAAAVGMDSSTYARQLLEKDLGRLKSTAAAGAGSDQRQATVLAGFPEAASDNQTIHTSMDYTRGVARQDLARGNLLNSVKEKDPTLRGFQHADDMLTGSTDPLMHEFNALKTPAQRIGFYQRNFTNPAEAQQFRDKVAGMGHIFGQ